jgi:hypothetical protein
MFLENISTFLKKDNRLLKKDKGVLKKGQHVSAYMPIMFSVHYSITKPIFFLLHLSFHLIKNTQSIKRLKLEPLPLTPVSTVSGKEDERTMTGCPFITGTPTGRVF